MSEQNELNQNSIQGEQQPLEEALEEVQVPHEDPALQHEQPYTNEAFPQTVQPLANEASLHADKPINDSKGIVSLVLGILSFLSSGLVFTGIIFGVIGLILARSSSRDHGQNGMATGGFVCCIIGIVLSVLFLLGYAVLIFYIIPTIGDDPSLFGQQPY